WSEAVITAVARGLTIFFAEIAQQRRAPAFAGFGVMHHLPELLARDALLAFALLIDEMRLLDDIARAEKQRAFARQPIAPGAARLLIIAFDVLRQIVMNDEPHVRFIDSHPEGDRRRDHPDVISEEQLLILGALPGRETGVIRFRLYPVLAQVSCQRIRRFSARAINDTAVVRPTSNDCEQLLVRCRFRNDAITEIRPVKAGDVTARIAQRELLEDVRADSFGCGRSECHNWHIRQMSPQLFQFAIFRPEIMTPFTDAMRLVDRALRNVPIERTLQKRVEHQAFWRDVKQLVLATMKPAQPRDRFNSI